MMIKQFLLIGINKKERTLLGQNFKIKKHRIIYKISRKETYRLGYL